MAKYAKGTQAMLDAAKNDATLLPFNTVFITNYIKGISQHDMPTGVKVTRKRAILTDSCESVAFEPFKNTLGYDESDWWFCDYRDLLPAKKPKQKKWQNGTQADLDAAKDDARLIPKKTYFRAKYGELAGMVVYRIDSIGDDSADVLMYNFGVDRSQYMAAVELEPIGEE